MNLVLSVRDLEHKRVVAFARGNGARGLSAEHFRNIGPLRALQTLRDRAYDEVVICGTSEELENYLAALSAASLAVSTRARRWEDITTGKTGPLTRRRILGDIAGMMRGTGDGLLAIRRKKREVEALTAGPRVAPVWNGPAERILYLKGGPFSNVKVGGSVGHVAGVANAMTRANLDVRMLAVAPQISVSDEVDIDIVPPPATWGLPVAVNAVRYSETFRLAAEAVARAWAPCLSYQRFSPQDLTGAHLRKMGIPWVVEYNGSEVWAQRNWGRASAFESLARRVEVSALRLADLVVVVSEPLKREVLELGVPEERVLCYPNCIDPGTFDPARFSGEDIARLRAEFGIAPDDLVLTFIGTFGEWHGTDVLADAIRDLIDRDAEWMRSKRIRFLLVGSGLRLQYAVDRLSQPGDEKFVHFAGVQPQARAPLILAASNILLSPHKPNDDGSAFFGSPTKFFEYLAMARLVIASDLEQIGDVARGWIPLAPRPQAGVKSDLMILVEPGSVDGLNRGIREACDMPAAEQERMALRCRDVANAHFTWDANVACVLERLQAVTGAPDHATHAGELSGVHS
ncbi:MAG: glycosyltransferase [Gemmatimonadota bacterium]